MGYLKEDKFTHFFIRLTDEQVREVVRLGSILQRTRKKRIKRKLAKRIDNMVKVE